MKWHAMNSHWDILRIFKFEIEEHHLEHNISRLYGFNEHDIGTYLTDICIFH